jgi:hypothetical protein
LDFTVRKEIDLLAKKKLVDMCEAEGGGTLLVVIVRGCGCGAGVIRHEA